MQDCSIRVQVFTRFVTDWHCTIDDKELAISNRGSAWADILVSELGHRIVFKQAHRYPNGKVVGLIRYQIWKTHGSSEMIKRLSNARSIGGVRWIDVVKQ